MEVENKPGSSAGRKNRAGASVVRSWYRQTPETFRKPAMTQSRSLPLCSILALYFLVAPSVAHARAAITLAVDATDAPRNLLHSRETIVVSPGPLTLLYPKWIPGEHGPTGPITDVVAVKITGGGKTLPWRRDLVEMYAIHCEVPAGCRSIEVSFDFILPVARRGFSSGASSSPGLLVLNWNEVTLYPGGEQPDSIEVTSSLKLPEEWKFATALEVNGREQNTIRFKPVPLTMLIDSPVQASRHFNRVDITAGMPVPFAIDIAGEDQESVEMPEPLVEKYRRLVREAHALFGARHCNHYDFLYTLSDMVAHFGLEHHQSSDDRLGGRTLLDEELQKNGAGLLPHEFVHSWNGKYRRPADLATGDYSTPMKDDLLWVYEGLTQYLGLVLTARSGLWSEADYREHLALVAAGLDHRPGREWRTLQDAADEASVLYDAPDEWSSYRRSVDFYDEGDLIWLEADVTIREQTHGRKSLGDFCRLFYGPPDTGPLLVPYTFDDVVAALGQVVPFDWRSFFTARLQALTPRAPLEGIESGGWRLVYRDTLSNMLMSEEKARKFIDMRFSLGMSIGEAGTVRDVIPGTPAAAAGIIPMMVLIAVNGRGYTPEMLRAAVREAAHNSSPIELEMSEGDYYRTYSVTYHGGEKYPFLERVPLKPDILDAILRPLAKD